MPQDLSVMKILKGFKKRVGQLIEGLPGALGLPGLVTSASAPGNPSTTYGQGLGNNNRERIALSLPCFLVVLLESYTGLWTFLTRPSVGIFLGLPDETLCLRRLCVAVWSCGEETSGQSYGGILQLFDTSTVNWFRAVSFLPIHTNKSFHFITLLICTTVVSGSCSCHTLAKPNAAPVPCTTTKTPNLLSWGVASIFCLSFFSLWPLMLTVLKHRELYLCSVVLLPKLLQHWGKMSFQKDISVPCCQQHHVLPWSPFLFLGNVTMLQALVASHGFSWFSEPATWWPLWFCPAPGFSAPCYFTDFLVQTAGLGDKSPRLCAQWSSQLLLSITFIFFWQV